MGALFAFVFAFPVDVVSARQLNLRVHLLDGFLDGAAKIAPAHAVLDRDVALVSFAVDFRAAVLLLDLAELREGNPFAGGRQQTNVLDGFLGGAVLREVTQHQVVSRLALQYLRESVASDGGLDGILNIRDVDLIARGLIAVHLEVDVRLAQNAKDAEVLDPFDVAHHVDDLIGLVLENS